MSALTEDERLDGLEAEFGVLEEIQNGVVNRASERRYGPPPPVTTLDTDARLGRLEADLGGYLFWLEQSGDFRFREDPGLRRRLEEYRDQRSAEYRARQMAVYAERAAQVTDR